MATREDINNTVSNGMAGGSRLIGGIPLLILMTLDGNSGQDLLDSLINYIQSLVVVVG